MLPWFFVVGPPRTGTSWLHEVLKNRATLPSSDKETRFFDVNFHLGLLWYRAQYPRRETGPVGEIAPTYFASHQARERIKKLVPWARIVCIFRNPVDRVISLYKLKRAYGLIPWELQEALLRDRELTESSLYGTFLRRWFEDFGRDQVLPMFYDDLRNDPQSFVNRIAEFIGIPRFTLTATENKVVYGTESMREPRNYLLTRKALVLANWLKAGRLGGVVSVMKSSPVGRILFSGRPPFVKPSDQLSETSLVLFRQEVAKLEVLLQRDLSAWKQVQEEYVPMRLTNATAAKCA